MAEDTSLIVLIGDNAEYCRLCAKPGGNISIFDKQNDCLAPSEQVMLLTPLKISPKDTLPHRICSTCAGRLAECFSFRKQCELADRFLRMSDEKKSSEEDTEVKGTATNELGASVHDNLVRNNSSDDISDQCTNSVEISCTKDKDDVTFVKSEDIKTGEQDKSEEDEDVRDMDCANWCDSDEEKLLTTALRLSDVRQSRDCVVEETGEENDSEKMCPDCGKLQNTIKAETIEQTSQNNDSLLQSLCSCEEDHISPEKSPTGQLDSLKDYISAGTPLLKVRADLFEDSPWTPKPDFQSEEKKKPKKRKLYHCSVCSNTCPTKSLLKKHQSTCTKTAALKKKKKQLSDARAVLQMTKSLDIRPDSLVIRSELKKKGRSCKVCGLNFQKKPQLKSHLLLGCSRSAISRIYPRNFMCEQCGRTFKQKTVLVQHMSTHSSVKMFACELCNKTFTRGAHVAVHMRIHNNIKPFVCETCGRSFTKSSDLHRHRRVHSEARDYPCSLCLKAFKRPGDVSSHMRTHTGDRPYKCEPCNKSYTNHSSLLKHRRNNCSHRRGPPASKDAKPAVGDAKPAAVDRKPPSPDAILPI